MLIQFRMKNVLSFKHETLLDLSAVKAYKEHLYNLMTFGNGDKALKVAAIFGANASGKTNLHFAMALFQNIIRESLQNNDEANSSALSKYYKPFSFTEESTESEFEIVCVDDKFEYKYGFSYTDKKICSEWMYRKSFETNRTSMLLERIGKTIKVGAQLRKLCDAYKEHIPPDTLVLSFFNKLNFDIFTEVYSLIFDTLVASTDIFENRNFCEKYLPGLIDDYKEELLSFIKSVDLGIVDIGYSNEDGEINFYTTHLGENKNRYILNLYNESQGTIKSIVLFRFVKLANEVGASLFIDELNTKLHPLLLKQIIDIFHSSKSNAQLIYTTHDTTLLDKQFFRRDQIWFVQKDKFGISELTALSDFKIRSDSSFEKDYLAGVYGGIPSIKSYELSEKK